MNEPLSTPPYYDEGKTKYKCSECKGEGKIYIVVDDLLEEEDCTWCDGSGELENEKPEDEHSNDNW